MQDPSLDDLLDRLVAEYSDRAAASAQGGEVSSDDLLAQVPEEHRGALERCFRMIRSGVASAPQASQPIGPGTRFEGYRVVREIGRGGMAVVYEAVQEDLQRRVAIKVLRAGIALEGRNVDRFRREALAVAKLKHPNIVAVHGVGEALGHHYLVMELVEGPTLEEAFDRLPELTSGRPWSPRDLAEATGSPTLAEHPNYAAALATLLAPVARAVGLAHELGLVHRDLKPSNILIHRDGRPVVADFGLAKADGDPGLSLTGEPLGTPFYMSPEQAAVIESPVDERSDVYSLGVTLYEGLTGRRPFEGDSVLAVIDAIRHRSPASPRSLHRALGHDPDAVVRKAMSRQPSDRYPTALDLATELTAISEERPTQAAAQEGGRIQRGVSALKRFAASAMWYGYTEYRSERELLGIPLVHINVGRRAAGEPLKRAKGWFAVGEIATGFVAFGPMAMGVFAWGALAVGGFTFAAIGLGLMAYAGIALGALTFGGISIGLAAIGGLSFGIYSMGGSAHGLYPHTDSNPNQATVDFFNGLWPF